MAKDVKKSAILSMTGFGSAEGKMGAQSYRVEMKSVNHRFLDLKLRMPRELQPVEANVKALIQSRVNRGALDVKFERITDGATANTVDVTLDLPLAKKYYERLEEIRTSLGLSESITAKEIASFPDVLARGASESPSEELWKQLEPIVSTAVAGLLEMREHEGASLAAVLNSAASELEAGIQSLREKRKVVSGRYPDRIREKIKAIFEAYPVSEGNLQAVLESRIAQELALLADRTDVEEELVRFAGHIEHLRKILREGGAVGRKLDFVLQELNREVNTLGNKAQDYGMSEEVVGAKVRLEQLREQVMNLE